VIQKNQSQDFKGRNSQNKMINFPKVDGVKPGDYVLVEVTVANAGTLKGRSGKLINVRYTIG
jgi:tRNA-2-methylthio-N6-dimethylallyladenosine synthase